MCDQSYNNIRERKDTKIETQRYNIQEIQNTMMMRLRAEHAVVGFASCIEINFWRAETQDNLLNKTRPDEKPGDPSLHSGAWCPDERSPQGQTGEDMDEVILGREACSTRCLGPCSSLDNWTNISMARAGKWSRDTKKVKGFDDRYMCDRVTFEDLWGKINSYF